MAIGVSSVSPAGDLCTTDKAIKHPKKSSFWRRPGRPTSVVLRSLRRSFSSKALKTAPQVLPAASP
jgi:hypothetical protein